MKQTVDWFSYWTQNRLGFHQAGVNTYLKQFLPLFNLRPGDAVFMPLCGKAVDILWLAEQGLNVIGVELSDIAIQSFFKESELGYEQTRQGDFLVYTAPNITLYQGDYMRLQVDHLACCKLVYDRASIVAIESFNRLAYTGHMLNIIPTGIPMLLVTLEYDRNKMQGPPFSVPVSEIRDYYHPHYQLEVLQSNQQIDGSPRWREMGLESFMETALHLRAV